MRRILVIVVAMVVFGLVGIFFRNYLKQNTDTVFRSSYKLNKVESSDEREKLLKILGLFENRKICLTDKALQKGECVYVNGLDVNLSEEEQELIYIADKDLQPIVTWGANILDGKLVFTISFYENRIPVSDKIKYKENIINSLISQQLANMVEGSSNGYRENVEKIGREIDFTKVKFVTLDE